MDKVIIKNFAILLKKGIIFRPIRARSLDGRAPHLHCGGQEFESPRVHPKKNAK